MKTIYLDKDKSCSMSCKKVKNSNDLEFKFKFYKDGKEGISVTFISPEENSVEMVKMISMARLD
jgi:hypothetical protein